MGCCTTQLHIVVAYNAILAYYDASVTSITAKSMWVGGPTAMLPAKSLIVVEPKES